MRILVVLAVALALAPSVMPGASATVENEFSITVLRIEGAGATIAWNPVPGAVTYHVYRGVDLNAMDLLGSTVATAFHDGSPPGVSLWYLVIAEGISSDYETRRGACVSQRGPTGISITLAHCTPSFP